jgi:hypothetical protein
MNVGIKGSKTLRSVVGTFILSQRKQFLETLTEFIAYLISIKLFVKR